MNFNPSHNTMKKKVEQVAIFLGRERLYKEH